jgi:putative nucleotidyltransferase with HDIG domain
MAASQRRLGREQGTRQEQSKPVGSLAALSAAIEARDPYARGHSSRVTVFAQAMARGLSLDKERLAVLRLGALLHDVGKLAVPSSVLLKRGPLTEPELDLMRRHPAAGARMLRSLGAPGTILPLVLHHHERWDGAGYPTGRSGEEIPLEARVLCIADSFDAMTSNRPYRAPWNPDEALAELERCSGSQFDPKLVAAFAAAWAEAGLGVLVWQEAAVG